MKEEFRVFKNNNQLVIAKTGDEKTCSNCDFYEKNLSFCCNICKNHLSCDEYISHYVEGPIAIILGSMLDASIDKFNKYVKNMHSSGEKLMSLPTSSLDILVKIADKLHFWCESVKYIEAGVVENLLVECGLSLTSDCDLTGYVLEPMNDFKCCIEKLDSDDIYWLNIPIFKNKKEGGFSNETSSNLD